MAEWIATNNYLAMPDMENNAGLVWSNLRAYGFTDQAVCAVLANMQQESTINPGLWYNRVENWTTAYGLVQWHPPTKYINWAGDGWRDNGNRECEYFNFEMDGGSDTWIPTSQYPLSSQEFKASTIEGTYLTLAFLHDYERPGNYPVEEPIRIKNYEYWYQWMTGKEPPDPPGPIPGRMTRKWWLFMPPWL